MGVPAKPQDKFWKVYMVSVAGGLLVIGAVLLVIFLPKSSNYGEGEVLGSEVPIHEYPFSEIPRIYKDTLTRGWESWSWDTNVDFSATLPTTSSQSIGINYAVPNAGFMIHAPHFSTAPYHTLKLSIYMEKDLPIFIELADARGQSLGSQLLSWYADDRAMKIGVWQDFTIPLANLNAASTTITSISVVGGTPGKVYLDNLEFSPEYRDYPRWVDGKAVEEHFNPIVLPYKSDFSSKSPNWKVSDGTASAAFSKMRVEAATSSQYTLLLLRGGDTWIDYKFSISLDWAQADSINLIARRFDDGNYYSCSFFDDGKNVTLYQVKDGKQIELQSLPNYLASRVYSWTKVKTLAIQAQNNIISCFSNGEEKIKYDLVEAGPLLGGAGVEMWSPKPGYNTLILNEVDAETR